MGVNQSIPALKTLYVYLTEGCNCACRHCYFVGDDTRQGHAGTCLTPADLRRAIEQALPLGLQRLKWTGGEPTLSPNFSACLEVQREFGLAASLESNGLLLTQELVQLLAECGVDQVSVSLDGAVAATHDRIRGVAGGFERSLAGVARLVAVGYRPELILTLQGDNFAEVESYLELAARQGAGSVKLNVMQPVAGVSRRETAAPLSVAEVLQLAERLDRAAAQQPLPVTLDVPLAFRPLAQIVSGARDGSCNILHVLGLLPDGSYALCGLGRRVPELAMGRVEETPLAELWRDHPLLRRIREGLPGQLQGVCGACLMRAACKGSCVAANYHLDGDLMAPFWFCRQAFEAGLFPASRLRPDPADSLAIAPLIG